jgi:hypothetical protein
VSGQPKDSQAVVTREADHCQASYFYDELHRQIELLNEQAEVFHAALATYLRRGEHRQAERMQRELRLSAVERRKLIDMLSALNHRFLSDQTTRPATSSRHRAPSSLASLGLTTQRRAATAPVR